MQVYTAIGSYNIVLKLGKTQIHIQDECFEGHFVSYFQEWKGDD